MKAIDGYNNKRSFEYLYKTLYRKLIKQIKQIIPAFDPEAIHQFRVTYKKYRALLRMFIQLHDSKTDGRIPKITRKIYKASGVLRDLQMQELRIKEFGTRKKNKPLTYLKFLRSESDAVKKILTGNILHKSIGKDKNKIKIFVPVEFLLTGLMSYFEKIYTTIHTILLSWFILDKDLHVVRKLLKDFLYNLEIFDINEQEIILKKYMNGNDKIYIDELLKELGEFQDKCASIALLSTYSRCHLSDYKDELLYQVMAKWKEEKVCLKQMIVKKLRTDLIVI